tara:strand:+ start:6632 stop:7114 length:483 start_codon:yes stop_codon:yes gene_type:complete
MKKFRVSEETLEEAKRRAEALPLLNNSIRAGEGAIVGYLGEALVKKVLNGDIKDTFDYDIIYGDGIRVDVKTKQRTSAPRGDYNCTVADFNTRQECDEYAFVSVLGDHTYAWYLGKIGKASFYEKATFYEAGELDPNSSPNSPFHFRAACYNLDISQLSQ